MTNQKTIKRLQHLHKMIGKYAHRWGENTSDRLYGWVTEYEQIRHSCYDFNADKSAYETWVEYCESVGAVTSHNAYDCLA